MRRVVPALTLALIFALVLATAGADEKPRAAGKPAAPAKGLLPKSWLAAMPWRPIGPANMGGRITSVAVYEKDPTLWWAATASPRSA